MLVLVALVYSLIATIHECCCHHHAWMPLRERKPRALSISTAKAILAVTADVVIVAAVDKRVQQPIHLMIFPVSQCKRSSSTALWRPSTQNLVMVTAAAISA
jgi:hypothetical protein